jgi:hypothetical protein
MLTQPQLQKIWLLSDTVLYPEAVKFMRKLVEEQKLDPLPTSQVAGLLSIAESENYQALEEFVDHQRQRDWPPSKRNIVTFYTTLQDILSFMKRKRLHEEFHLLTHKPGRSASDTLKEIDALMALLASEFIQHLLAENGALAAKLDDDRKRQRTGRRIGSW